MALLPSYVFVRIRRDDRLKVVQVPGVVDIVSVGGVPAPLPEREIETLRTGWRERKGMEPHPYLVAGRKVRIVHGPFTGLEGLLVRRKENYRVVLSIPLLQRAVAIEVAEPDVAPTR